MALVNCPACTREISDQAASCPACGHPVSRRAQRVDSGENVFNRNRGCGDILLFGPIVLLVVGALWCAGIIG